MSLTTPLEPGNRIQLPAEWIAELGVHEKVVLEKTAQGIVIRPAPATQQPATGDLSQFERELRARQAARGHTPPTKEEVDAYLNAERDSWDA
jgi:hypothetical protein